MVLTGGALASTSSAASATAAGSLRAHLGATAGDSPNGTLAAVACKGARFCVAVGWSINNAGHDVALAETWNGKAWRIRNTPDPGGMSVSLSGVSCISPKVCTAVGTYFATSDFMTLAERWNGRTWKVQPTPNPLGGTSVELAGVSCASSKVCTAVGRYVSSGDYVPLAEGWNGKTWHIQTTPNPQSSTSTSLVGVSCTSKTACTAVGESIISGVVATLAERWNGKSWTKQVTSNPTGAFASLGGVSCTSKRSCSAAGDANGVTLAEYWNGKTWAVQATPDPRGGANFGLASLACATKAACTAVGDYTLASSYVTLAEHWNGKTWAVQTTANPRGSTRVQLGGVSCASSTACTAVGSYLTGPIVEATLAEHWNGKTWVIQATSNRSGKVPS